MSVFANMAFTWRDSDMMTMLMRFRSASQIVMIDLFVLFVPEFDFGFLAKGGTSCNKVFMYSYHSNLCTSQPPSGAL